jgi:lipid-A-disaccharide synthase
VNVGDAFAFPPAQTGHVDLLIIAGEHSGDEHAARMIRELQAKHPGIAVAALGGPQLAAAGAQLLYDLTASSVVGLVEVLKHYGWFRALFNETVRWIEQYRPRAVCFIDYPGFNLRLAATLRERGLSVKGGGSIRTLYYISPQIWAWKAGRRFAMARNLDAMAVIFPFEPQHYADTALPVEFVGHPFVVTEYTAPVRYDASGPVLLLPGSRVQAVRRIFPVLLAGFQEFVRTHPSARAFVLFPSDEILAVLCAAEPPANVEFLPVTERRGVARAPIGAAAVLTSSGTMSMHCALAGIPGAIAYRANPVTYALGRMLVRVDQLGISNLLLGESMYPEFLQGAATPAALAGELRACIDDPARRTRVARQAARLREMLSVPASGTAADWLGRQLAPTGGSGPRQKPVN